MSDLTFVLSDTLDEEVARSERRLSHSEKCEELLAFDTPEASMIWLSVPLARSGVHRHNKTMPVVGMSEDVVTPLGTVEFPAAPLERAHRLARCHRR